MWFGLDMFGKKAELTLPSGKTSYRTCTGCICSILTVGIVGLFAVTLVRDKVLDERNKYMIHGVEKEHYLSGDAFSFQESDFMMAFGVD